MVFNATFKNISVTSWRTALLVEETGVPGKTIDLDKRISLPQEGYSRQNNIHWFLWRKGN